jgi:hypothetical protein
VLVPILRRAGLQQGCEEQIFLHGSRQRHWGATTTASSASAASSLHRQEAALCQGHQKVFVEPQQTA